MDALLRERYQPLEVVGAGGQGEVIRAIDRQHGRPVAIKKRRLAGPSDRALILREARLLLDLTPHVGLPLVREDFFDGDSYYLVMDWIEGTNLEAVITRRRTGLPLLEALGYLREVAAVLDHLHGHSPPVLHRDVKPSNIIVTREGRVVLVDFGISGYTGGQTLENAGTLGYLAPEDEATPAADVYGLAATALALLCGHAPRPGPRPALPGVDERYLDHVWTALDAGLAYAPERRPASAGQFVASIAPPVAPHNLPEQPTSFVGRDGETARVAALLDRERLVTITGAPGLGKTRLAIEVARRALARHPDGAWLVELAGVSEPEMVSLAVAAALGIAEDVGRTALASLREDLGERRALIVLDNCEHVRDAAGDLVADLLRECPNIRILATSQQALDVPGEVVDRLEPLSLPGGDDPGQLFASDAGRLFLDRGRAARPGWEPSAEDAAAAARICRRLDGLPLAIELAAARLGTLTCQQIDARLDDRFQLLTKGRRAGPERQRTLRAAVEWSYELLTPAERTIFARLAVFAGGFTLEAAEAVAGTSDDPFSPPRATDDPGGEVLDVVGELVAKSLLVSDERAGAMRYRMLETVRAFGVEKLVVSGEDRVMRTRHLTWFADTVERGERERSGTEREMWLEGLGHDDDNLRAALQFGISGGNTDAALRLAAALGPYFAMSGHWEEGRRWLEDATRRGQDISAKARAHGAAGHLAFLQGDYDVARDLHGQALRSHTAIGDRRGIARALTDLGHVAEARGDLDTARSLYNESLGVCREVGDEAGIGSSLTNLGNVAESLGDYEAAQKLHEEGLSVFRELGDKQGIATSLVNLGYVAQYQDPGTSGVFLDEALRLFREIGDRHGQARALNLLAIRTYFLGDPETAQQLGVQSLRMRHELGDKQGLAVSLESLGGLAAFLGEGEQAARLLGAAEVLRARIGSPITPNDQGLMDWAISSAKASIDDADFHRAWAEGKSMPLDAAVELAADPPREPRPASDPVVPQSLPGPRT